MIKLKNVIFITFIIFLTANAFAQPHKEKHGPPSWAPAHGFRAQTRYIYFPEHNIYYDLKLGVYIYYKSNKWITSVDISKDLGIIDLNVATKIELDYTGDHPEHYNKEHKEKYKLKEKEQERTQQKTGNNKNQELKTTKSNRRR